MAEEIGRAARPMSRPAGVCAGGRVPRARARIGRIAWIGRIARIGRIGRAARRGAKAGGAALAALLAFAPGAAPAAEIQPGQAWSCPATAETPDLTYVIGGIDRLGELGLAVPASEAATEIVHVTILPTTPDARHPAVTHMPFTRLSLIACRGRLLGQGANLPDGFGAAVEHWRDVYAASQAGYFVVPLPEAYAMAMRAVASQEGQQ